MRGRSRSETNPSIASSRLKRDAASVEGSVRRQDQGATLFAPDNVVGVGGRTCQRRGHVVSSVSVRFCEISHNER